MESTHKVKYSIIILAFVIINIVLNRLIYSTSNTSYNGQRRGGAATHDSTTLKNIGDVGGNITIINGEASDLQRRIDETTIKTGEIIEELLVKVNKVSLISSPTLNTVNHKEIDKLREYSEQELSDIKTKMNKLSELSDTHKVKSVSDANILRTSLRLMEYKLNSLNEKLEISSEILNTKYSMLLKHGNELSTLKSEVGHIVKNNEQTNAKLSEMASRLTLLVGEILYSRRMSDDLLLEIDSITTMTESNLRSVSKHIITLDERMKEIEQRKGSVSTSIYFKEYDNVLEVKYPVHKNIIMVNINVIANGLVHKITLHHAPSHLTYSVDKTSLEISLSNGNIRLITEDNIRIISVTTYSTYVNSEKNNRSKRV